MNYLIQFVKNVKASPKTSALGMAGIVGAGIAAFQSPPKLSTAEWWTVLFVSAGLLYAPDIPAAPK